MRKVLLIVFVLALLAAACSGDGEPDSEAGPVTTSAGTETTSAPDTSTATTTTTAAADTSEPTSASETTETPGATESALAASLGISNERPSSRLEGSMTMTDIPGADPGTEMIVPFSGEFDAETGNSTFITDLSAIAAATPSSAELPNEMASMFGEMETRTIGDTTYMRFGFFSVLGVQTEWVSFPVEQAGSTAASFGAGPTNPMDFMDAWNSAGTEIEELGSETVRGVSTTHYRVSMDATAMVEAADPGTAEELAGLGTAFADSVPVDFWVGDDGNLYRIMMDIEDTESSTGGAGSITILWEMFDHGADITVEAPPADQVTDGTQLDAMFSDMFAE